MERNRWGNHRISIVEVALILMKGMKCMQALILINDQRMFENEDPNSKGWLAIHYK